MRKIGTILFILLMLVLDWAALHDILKGESDVLLEWSFVIGSVLLLIVLLIRRSIQAS